MHAIIALLQRHSPGLALFSGFTASTKALIIAIDSLNDDTHMLAHHSQLCFVSDVHIMHDHCPQAQRFMQFCEQLPEQVTHLYLLGDFFDVWLGPETAHQHQHTLRFLFALSQRLQIYFMPGNHDFLFPASLAHEFGMHFLPDPYLVQIGDTRLLLSHGDLLCQHDRRYQRYRRIVRHPITQQLFAKLPYRIRSHIGKQLQDQNSQPTLPKDNSQVDEAFAAQWLRDYHVNALVHGHTHQPHRQQYPFDKSRWVLGAWHHQPSALLWNQTSGLTWLSHMLAEH